MNTPPEGVSETLTLLLNANAHGKVLEAIIETLGPSILDQLESAVRLLDARVTQQAPRQLEAVAREVILEPKPSDSARKRLERMARAYSRRSARVIVGAQDSLSEGSGWRTAAAVAALDILRAHGAVDVLNEWINQDARRTERAGRQKQAESEKKVAEIQRLALELNPACDLASGDLANKILGSKRLKRRKKGTLGFDSIKKIILEQRRNNPSDKPG